MNILILGGGGREHSLAWAAAQNPKCDRLIVAPGNPGMAQIAECAALDIADGTAVAEFAVENAVDFVIVGPEAPLAAGVSDALVAAGVLAMAAKYAFGPAPAVHHDKALKAEGMESTVAMQIVLRAVYVPMAAACAALTVVVVVLALGPIWDGELWACVTATVAALVLGVPT